MGDFIHEAILAGRVDLLEEAEQLDETASALEAEMQAQTAAYSQWLDKLDVNLKSPFDHRAHLVKLVDFEVRRACLKKTRREFYAKCKGST